MTGVGWVVVVFLVLDAMFSLVKIDRPLPPISPLGGVGSCLANIGLIVAVLQAGTGHL